MLTINLVFIYKKVSTTVLISFMIEIWTQPMSFALSVSLETDVVVYDQLFTRLPTEPLQKKTNSVADTQHIMTMIHDHTWWILLKSFDVPASSA